MSSSATNIHIRVAKPEEYHHIAVLARQAFIHDPLLNYLGDFHKLLPEDAENADTKNIETFFLFFLYTCHYVGGIITIGVKSEAETSKEEIVCAAFWCPPNKRVTLWKIPTLLRSGVLKVLKAWGWTALKRMGDYSDPSHAIQDEIFKEKGLKFSPDSAWYLQLIFTNPENQGQGFMSVLIKEAFNNAPPGVPIVLEASTAKSRDRYAHLGFELVKEFTVGKGKANSEGIVATGHEAVGFPIWTMVYWNSERKNNKT